MKLSATCVACIVRRQAELIEKFSEEQQRNYMEKVLSLLQKQEESAPAVTEEITRLYTETFGPQADFVALKKSYNKWMLEKEDFFRQEIQKAEDSLFHALRLARAGNYIDFGAMGSVNEEKLSALLEDVRREALNEKDCEEFRTALAKAKNLVYCTDNCGEILLDKLFIEEIKRVNPRLTVTALVRGKPVLNDATVEDALQVGMAQVADVLSNGSGAAGTVLGRLSEDAQKALYQADVIISKGQGNFESLHGCGLPVYYLFLCKCHWFTRRFGLKQYAGVFIHERDVGL